MKVAVCDKFKGKGGTGADDSSPVGATQKRNTVKEAEENFKHQILQRRSSQEARKKLGRNGCIESTRVGVYRRYPDCLTGVGLCHARAHFSAGADWKEGMTVEELMEQPLPTGSQTYLLREFHSVSLNTSLGVYTDDADQFRLLDYSSAVNVLNAFCEKYSEEEKKDKTSGSVQKGVRWSSRQALKKRKDEEVGASQRVRAKR